jgi:hypothetical protein
MKKLFIGLFAMAALTVSAQLTSPVQFNSFSLLGDGVDAIGVTNAVGVTNLYGDAITSSGVNKALTYLTNSAGQRVLITSAASVTVVGTTYTTGMATNWWTHSLLGKSIPLPATFMVQTNGNVASLPGPTIGRIFMKVTAGAGWTGNVEMDIVTLPDGVNEDWSSVRRLIATPVASKTEGLSIPIDPIANGMLGCKAFRVLALSSTNVEAASNLLISKLSFNGWY